MPVIEAPGDHDQAGDGQPGRAHQGKMDRLGAAIQHAKKHPQDDKAEGHQAMTTGLKVMEAPFAGRSYGTRRRKA